VQGVRALEAALEAEAPECRFVVLFSSMAAILGGYGMVAYAAANCFMDSFVAAKALARAEAEGTAEGEGCVWRSANWDDWAFEYGKEQTAVYELTGTAAVAIQPAEGFECLQRILACEEYQVLVSPRALAPRAEQWLYQTKAHAVSQGEPEKRSPSQAGGDTSSADLQTIVLQELKKSTMDDDLSPTTSFFDVGGDSLMAAELLSSLKAAVPAAFLPHLSIRALIANPTAAGLAEHLKAHAPPDEANELSSGLEFQHVQVILEEFRRVLIEDDLEPHQNFFNAGGDSLMAAELLVGLKRVIPADRVNQPLSIKALFAYPTAEALANYLTSQ